MSYPSIEPHAGHARPHANEIETVLRACRVLIALTARSIAATPAEIGVLQVRALFVVSDLGTTSLSELADAIGIHLTRASRLCDRLVKAGLLHREDDPANRRQVLLRLTASGAEVVCDVRQNRADAIAPILAAMGPESRARLVHGLADFAAAAGPYADTDLWAAAWER